VSQSVTVADTITKIRQQADQETADQANSVITDAELVSVINDGYRALYDILAAEGGVERFATSATLAAPSFTLPAGFYQALGVDFPNFWGTGQALTARRFSFAERNRRSAWLMAAGYDVPSYRIQNGAVVWEPASAAPADSVTLWYIPTPSALASNGSFDAINGCDDFVVAWGVRYCREKQEEDNKSALLKLAQAEQRVRSNAARIVRDPVVVADLRDDCSESFYNS
jgi:hypothetical protein